MKTILCAALLGASCAAVNADEPPGVLRVRAIELVDQRGTVRAQLDVEPTGEVVFRLRDPRGAIRVKLGAGEDGAGLVLMNHTAEPGVHALAKRAGTTLALKNAGGATRVLAPE